MPGPRGAPDMLKGVLVVEVRGSVCSVSGNSSRSIGRVPECFLARDPVSVIGG